MTIIFTVSSHFITIAIYWNDIHRWEWFQYLSIEPTGSYVVREIKIGMLSTTRPVSMRRELWMRKKERRRKMITSRRGGGLWISGRLSKPTWSNVCLLRSYIVNVKAYRVVALTENIARSTKLYGMVKMNFL